MNLPSPRGGPPDASPSLKDPVRVLLTDDEALNRRLLRRYLERAGMHVTEATDGNEALRQLRADPTSVDVVVLDLLMPGMGGEQVLTHMSADPTLARIPVLVASSLNSRESMTALMALGASDFLDKPVRSQELVARIHTLARLARCVAAVDGATAALLELGRRVEQRDDDLQDHCEHLSELADYLGRAFALPDRDLVALRHAGALHDLGKIGIPESVLLKAGPHDAEERALMRSHPAEGDALLAGVTSLADVRPIVRHHHEAWDGSGYPDGLVGEETPFVARVFRLADSYLRLRTTRMWRLGVDHEAALAALAQQGRDGLWEPSFLERGLEALAAYDQS